MTWFKVDDQLAFHRKVVAAGNAAMGLWVRSGSWCAEHLTDGFIPDHMVAIIGTPSQAKRLVSVGLWIEVPGGCQFHQWNENGRQPTSQSVRERREKAAERQARWRGQTFTDTQVSNGSHGVTYPLVTPPVTPSVTATPTRPVLSTKESTKNTWPSEHLSVIDTSVDTKTARPSSRGPDPFVAFYAAYPRKEDRKTAERAWRAAVKSGVDPEQMIAAARRYADQTAGTQRKFIKLPSSWLNAGAYDNEVPADDDPAVTGERRVQL